MRLAGEPLRTMLGGLVHDCEICGSNAPFGHGVDLRAGRLGLWYCRDHDKYREPDYDAMARYYDDGVRPRQYIMRRGR